MYSHEFKYDRSWDSLMSVVEKIENGFHWNHEVHIYGGHCKITNFMNNKTFMGSSKIEAVYKAITEFIKYQNSLKINKI